MGGGGQGSQRPARSRTGTMPIGSSVVGDEMQKARGAKGGGE